MERQARGGCSPIAMQKHLADDEHGGADPLWPDAAHLGCAEELPRFARTAGKK
jgi:hypothetical protein